MERSKRSPAAVMAGGLMILAALIGCGGEESVASKSAAAFREAQKRGETFGGAGHGHGAVTPGGGTGAPEGAPPGHEHAGAETPAGETVDHEGAHGGMAHPGAAPGAAGEQRAGGHAAMEHGRAAVPGGHGGHAAMGLGRSPAAPSPGGQEGTAQPGPHAGHAMPRETPPAASPAGEGHAGHAPAPAGVSAATPVPAPGPVPPGQPATTLRPDALDAPAATSVVDAQRSAEMAGGMAGAGHGGHGSGTYRHVDAGRGPGAYEGSEPQTPGAEPHQHDPATQVPSGQEGEHSHEPPAGPGAAENAAVVYACPMHPDVTSKAPGKCPKCGMTLVQRRKG